MRHAVCEILGIEKLDEDDLYENLGWLAEHQEEIEWQLFKLRFPHETPTLFLYDVTSSYLEGDCNAFGRWGYNRDKKKGKKQIVVGLLTGPDGLPVAVRVFEGNTSDSKTVSEQVRILAKSFSVQSVTLVGDRGMLKGPQVDELPEDFRHITAITKPQIQKMLSENTLQLELFTEKVSEVETDGVRYILRRNPVRAEEMTESRKSKLAAIKKTADDQTNYLGDHPRADPEKALARVVAKIKKVKAQAWVVPKVEDRTIRVEEDEEALSTVALLDGCYVIKTDVPKCDADKQTIHDRYCDLQMVERAFRTMKATHLELRPVFVTKKTSTQGHVFAVMLAFLVQRELERCWVDMDVTIREGIEVLGAVHMQEIRLGDTTIQDIPKPSKLGQQLLERAGTTLPSVLPKTTANVHTKKKLSSERKAL